MSEFLTMIVWMIGGLGWLFGHVVTWVFLIALVGFVIEFDRENARTKARRVAEHDRGYWTADGYGHSDDSFGIALFIACFIAGGLTR